MKTQLKCPSCGHLFNLEDVLTEDVEKDIRTKYEEENKQRLAHFQQKQLELEKEKRLFDEKKQRENELFLERVQKETAMRTEQAEALLRKQIQEEQQVKLSFLEKEQAEAQRKLQVLQERELEVLQLTKQLAVQKEEEQFNLQKQRLELEHELKEKLSDEILSREREKHTLEKRELEKQLLDQKKLTEQMTRKLEQGSMQMQGEVQELELEDLLREAFPFDEVMEVGKGRRGADCALRVRNELGQECGLMLFESKRTKEFDRKWLGKLREDLLEAKGDIPVLVSQALPEGMTMVEQREGVWICRFQDVVAIVRILREGLIQVARAKKSQENKGEKKEMLYTYFTGNEFRQQMQAIQEAYLQLKMALSRERLQMEKIWKERETQIDKVLLNNTHLLGTIKGIAGGDMEEIHLLE